MKQKRFFIIAGIIGILLASSIGYRVYNKPHRNIAREKPAFTLSADALYDAFEADESGANEKFLDQVIVVSGELEDISFDTDGMPVYTLKAEQAMIGGVNATLADAADRDDSLQPGDAVQLKCRCTGNLLDVVLVDCSLINAGS